MAARVYASKNVSASGGRFEERRQGDCGRTQGTRSAFGIGLPLVAQGTLSAALLTLVVLPVTYRAAIPLLERLHAVDAAPVVPVPGE